MKTTELKALLIGENSQGSSHLVKLLSGHGCQCSFATSYQEACDLLASQPFDVVLSPLRLRDCSMFPLADQFEGSKITLFYFQLVEDGCWWLPALRSGSKCFGSHALRPSEFVISLNEIIAERQAELPRQQLHAVTEKQILSMPAVVPNSASVVPISRSWSNSRQTAARASRALSLEVVGRRG